MVCSWRSDQNTKPFGHIPQPSLSSVRTEPCELFWILSQHSLKKAFCQTLQLDFSKWGENPHKTSAQNWQKLLSLTFVHHRNKKTNFAASLNLLNQWRSINTEVGGNISNILFHGTVFYRYQIIVPTVSQYTEIYRIVSPYRDTNLITRFSSTHCCLQIGLTTVSDTFPSVSSRWWPPWPSEWNQETLPCGWATSGSPHCPAWLSPLLCGP